MNRQIPILGGLLAAALVGSYLSWTAEKDSDDADEIIVLDAEAEDITAVSWDSEKLDLDLTVQEDALGRWMRVKSTELKKRPKPKPPEPEVEEGDEEPDEGAEEDGAEDEAPQEPAPPPEPEFIEEEVVKEFKVGDAGEELLESLAPFKAKRLLKVATDDKLAELGLDEPDATLSVTRADKGERTFQLGGEAYGTKDRYLRDTESGRVYLIDDQLIRPLKYGNTRLPDRELLGISADELERVRVTTADGAAELTQRNRSDPKAAYWAPVGSEDPSESAKGWIDKLLRLRSSGYVQADEVPTSTEVRLTVVATDAEGQPVTVEVLSGVDPEGDAAWYARSEHARMLVSLHSAQATDLVDDASTILD